MLKPLLAPENDYSALGGVVLDNPSLRVAVVIPVFNRVDLLRRTLAGLTSQSYPRHLLRVVIADDGSDEDVPGAVAEYDEELETTVLRREHEGYGAGQARNLGAFAADDSELLVFFDADCIPDPDAVLRHAGWHHLAPNLVVIGSRHHLDTSPLTPTSIRDIPHRLRELAFGDGASRAGSWESADFRGVLHRRTGSLRYGDEAFRSLVSSNFSVARETFLRVEGFSADFTRWGGEDTELGWRLWNDGVFFVDEPMAAIYHQKQEDAGSEGWRERGRRSNEGLIQSKIPHRFYRSPSNVINETPKVSIVIHSSDGSRLTELADQVMGQRLADLEVIVTNETPEVEEFLERRSADPRFGGASSLPEALTRTHGEFVALVHGSSALDHRLLSRSVAALERRPRAGVVRSAYGVPHGEGVDVYRTPEDMARLDKAWSDNGLPIFALTRRRDLVKHLRIADDLTAAWRWVGGELEHIDHTTPLVWLPAASPSTERPQSFTPPRSLRSELLEDLKSGGRRAAIAPVRAVRSKITGRPFRTTPASPATPEPVPAAQSPRIRYVGWSGHSNLGDEALLRAISDHLFDWAEVEVDGAGGDLLMLGGGTLINRGYLRHLRRLDSPRRERVTFGTGVAHPDYWGEPKEPVSEWLGFLESCAYVGVRGPESARLLDRWGMKREVEVIGDPALSLQASAAIDKVEGRIVVCPAWTRGRLWGGSDATVGAAFSRLLRDLRAQGHEVWALSAFPGDDRFIIEMMRDADWSDLPYLAAHDDPGAAVDLLATAELAVAERLHGAVLAAAAGTVPVMVEYQPKLRDFAESVELSDLVLRTDALDSNALTSMTRQAFTDRETLAVQMGKLVDGYRSRQKGAARRIREIITG